MVMFLPDIHQIRLWVLNFIMPDIAAKQRIPYFQIPTPIVQLHIRPIIITSSVILILNPGTTFSTFAS